MAVWLHGVPETPAAKDEQSAEGVTRSSALDRSSSSSSVQRQLETSAPIPTGPVPPPAASLADRVVEFEARYATWSMDAIRARAGELRAGLAALCDPECASLLGGGRFEVVPYERDEGGRVLAYADTRAGRAEIRPVHDPRIVRIYDAPARDAWLRVELPRDQYPDAYAIRIEHAWLVLVVDTESEQGVADAMARVRVALGLGATGR